MSEFVTVDIPQGKLRGKKVTSPANGVNYYSFQGIPYAKPPVGPLRFKPPEEPESWTGIRDATVEGAVAPQFDAFICKKLMGEEDCLFLNVYTPQLPATSPKAVMVWIHGGGFVVGSGNTDFYGPDYLLAEDVVVVTINYRLGALGFLYLEGADITGNNGLRDQVMALKWVKNNIAHFGGDPGNVTIFGESAGGASVHFLTLSPQASGFFHRAIAQSGTALLCGGFVPQNVSSGIAVRLAKLLGYTSEDPQEIVDFLRTVPPEKLITQRPEDLLEEKNRILCLPFYPSEEVGPEAFFPASPRTLLDEGRFIKVPFMAGVTSAEGLAMLFQMFLRVKLSEIDEQFDNTLPSDLVPKIDTERSKEIAKIVKNFYFGESHLGVETVSQYVDLMSDLGFVYPLHKTVQSQIKWSPHPTYVYLFDYTSETAFDFMLDHVLFISKEVFKSKGAAHSAEVQYLFRVSLATSGFPPGSADAVVSNNMVKMWTQFAKTGNPSNGAVNIDWIPAEKGKHNYLNIRENLNMDADMYKDRMDFLDELYSKYLNPETK